MDSSPTNDQSLLQGQREPETPQQARQIIEDIRAKRGGLKHDTIQHLTFQAPESARDDVFNIIKDLLSETAKSVKSMTSVNSSDTHFIYELLQNADDAHSRFRSRINTINREQAYNDTDPPRLRFLIKEDSIIVQSNEPGFNRSDVNAICRINESSKTLASGYQHIGEKGIGFKSVFMIAETVHISSGLWNFRFEYPEGDEGLGMVTPLLDLPEPRPDGVGTQIKLMLNRSYREQRSKIQESFNKIPDTTIFYMPNIQILEIVTEQTDGTMSHTRFSKIEDPASCRRTITKESWDTPQHSKVCNMKTISKHFFVYSRTYTSMPSHELRLSNSATVELAFPLNDLGNALIDEKGQYVSAYLPLYRQPHLPFMIQSDFITATNRETIRDCKWNDSLLVNTADTFCSAVARFCRSGFLVYEWPKFLPSSFIDGFWGSLRSLIIDRLGDKLVFATWTSGTLRVPRQLLRVPDEFRCNNMPLLPDFDSSREAYLAPHYDSYIEVLKELDMPTLNSDQTLERLRADLQNNRSRVRNVMTSPQWHEAFSYWLLLLCAREKNQHIQTQLKRMNIIPLISGRWRSADMGTPSIPPPYLPTIEGVRVPSDLGYELVNPQACSSANRLRLFRELGVVLCKKEEVWRDIRQRHKFRPHKALPSNMADHLYFLYRFHCSVHDQNLPFFVMKSSMEIVSSKSEIYLPSDRPFSVEWLINKAKAIDPSKKLQMVDWILHKDYFGDQLKDRPGQQLGWKAWLGQGVGFWEFPAIAVPGSREGEYVLSAFLSVILSVSSPLFLSTLQAHWNGNYERVCSAEVSNGFRFPDCLVEASNGKRVQLSKTYMPSKEVIARATELNTLEQSDILKLDLGERSFVRREWAFLEELGVKKEVDVEFYLNALQAMSERQKPGRAELAYECLGSAAQMSQAPMLRKRFEAQNLLFCPHTSRQNCWYNVNECVWDGPSFLTVKKPLSSHYKDTNAVHLFRSLLNIRNANWLDLVAQLEFLKSLKSGDNVLNQVTDIYCELNVMKTVDLNQLRSIFARKNLVFADGLWHSPASCVWTSAVPIEGQPILQKSYQHHDNFFVVKLGVQKATIRQVVSELIRLAKTPGGLTVDNGKLFLQNLSTMLTFELDQLRSSQPEMRAKDLISESSMKELLSQNFLPVRDISGSCSLVEHTVDFAIRDHYEYSLAFADAGPFLDFAFEEYPQIETLIQALSLEPRCLSKLVDADEDMFAIHGDMYSEIFTKELTSKSAHLLSCAYKCRSLRAVRTDNSLLHELQTLKVYTCTAISVELTLELDGETFTRSRREAQAALEVVDKTIHIYLPDSDQQRKSAFRSKLPIELINHMRIEIETEWNRARSAISLILLNPLPELEEIMQTESIPCVPWLDRAYYHFDAGNNEFLSNPVASYADVSIGNLSATSSSTTTGAVPFATPTDSNTLGHDSTSFGHQQVASSNRPFIFGTSTEFSQSFSFSGSVVDHRSNVFKTASPKSSQQLNRGTSHTQFTPVTEKETNGAINSYQSIALQAEYHHYSFEELRLADYEAGRQFRSGSVPAPIQSTRLQQTEPRFHDGGLQHRGEPIQPLSREEQERYKTLLVQTSWKATTKAGGNREKSINGLIAASASLSIDDTSLNALTESTFGPPGFDHNSRKGAAGELYVFQMLKTLGLPNFGYTNWQSTIRHHAAIHPEYQDLPVWDGIETADIVYRDTSGRLKSWLGLEPLSKFPEWAKAEGIYTFFIEVKTTTDAFETRFFMSSKQVERMHNMSHESTRKPWEVYVIIRVFHLGSDVKHEVFIDPWRCRKDFTHTTSGSGLVVTAQKWELRPIYGFGKD